MKYVYSFKEGNKDMRNILGGKGANLCEMAKIGLPVPNGFIVSTDACNNYYENNKNKFCILMPVHLFLHGNRPSDGFGVFLFWQNRHWNP